jgi:hypothetical protein
MMNICAVRTIKNFIGHENAKRSLHERPLRHEPVTYDPLKQNPKQVYTNGAVLLFICIHCGCVFEQDEV